MSPGSSSAHHGPTGAVSGDHPSKPASTQELSSTQWDVSALADDEEGRRTVCKRWVQGEVGGDSMLYCTYKTAALNSDFQHPQSG